MNASNENSLLQNIYVLNKVLRKYRVNFYYSIKKDGIFILNGWVAKDRLNMAYALSALGSVLFAFSFFYSAAIIESYWLYLTIKLLSIVSLFSGIFILFDFYSRLKNLKTTTLIMRNGISFRNNSEIEFWPVHKIKNIEAVNTVSKKNAMKLVSEETNYKKEGKLIIFNQLGESKEILVISNKNRDDAKVDLESVKSILKQFMSLSQKNEQMVHEKTKVASE